MTCLPLTEELSLERREEDMSDMAFWPYVERKRAVLNGPKKGQKEKKKREEVEKHSVQATSVGFVQTAQVSEGTRPEDSLFTGTCFFFFFLSLSFFPFFFF